MPHRAVLLLATGLLLSHGLAMGWPAIELPPRATPRDMGGPVVINGLPVRTRGFVSPEAPARVTDWFSQHLGAPLMRQALGGRLLLGRMIDGFYVTVQIEATRPGTRGLIGMSDLQGAAQDRPAYESTLQALLDRLPAESRMLNHTVAHDGAQTSTQWLYRNPAGAAANEERLVRLFKEQGLALQRRVAADAATAGGGGVTLYFAGPRREASAAIQADPAGGTAVHVLRTIYGNSGNPGNDGP